MAEYYVKINGDSIKKYESLYEKTRDVIDGLMTTGVINYISDELLKCESPIEQILYAELLMFKAISSICNTKYFVQIFPQQEITVVSKKYRVDFLLKCTFGQKTNLTVVECDGHEFHEKTKEQAARDKKRDRDLTNSGYKVLHFTGSEIFSSPATCYMEITKSLHAFEEDQT